MTRIAILSDIHGNAPALRAVIADMQAYKPDHVVVAGDVINGALHDLEVLDILFKQNQWSIIRGNHEFYLLSQFTDHPRPNNPIYDHLKATLRDWHPLIAALPDELTLHYPDGPPIRVVHGIPGDNQTAITRITPADQVRERLNGLSEPVMVAGHYHLSVDRHVNGWHLLNAGPVGMICDGVRSAAYLLLDAQGDHWQPTFRRVAYDFAPIAARFTQLRDTLGPTGRLVELQIKYARPIANPYFRWRDRTYPDMGNTVTWATVQEFIALAEHHLWDMLNEPYQVNRAGMPTSLG